MVEDLLSKAPRHVSIDDAIQEAWIATTEAIDKADYRADDGTFFHELEQIVRRKVSRYIDESSKPIRRFSGPVYKRNDAELRARIQKDEATPPAEYDSRAIPAYLIRMEEGAVSTISFRSVYGWCHRPPGLVFRHGIYGLYVLDNSMLPRFGRGDLVLLDMARVPPTNLDDCLVVLKSSGNSEAQVLLGHVEEINDHQATVVPFADPSRTQKFPAGTPLHRLLKMQDVV